MPLKDLLYSNRDLGKHAFNHQGEYFIFLNRNTSILTNILANHPLLKMSSTSNYYAVFVLIPLPVTDYQTDSQSLINIPTIFAFIDLNNSPH